MGNKQSQQSPTNVEELPRVFVVGQNKTGTSSIHDLYRSEAPKGALSVHWEVDNKNVSNILESNFKYNRDIFEGLPKNTRMITDAEDVVQCTFSFKNYDLIQSMKEQYPDSKFVLNVRDEDRFLTSREKHYSSSHKNTPYAEKWAQCHNVDASDREAVREAMRTDFRTHSETIQSMFKDDPERLLVYDIENDPADTLRAFVGLKPNQLPLPRKNIS